MKVQLGTEWQSSLNLEFVNLYPRFDIDGQKITNPIAYCLSEVLEIASRKVSDDFAGMTIEIKAMIVSEKPDFFRAIAEMRIEE